MQNAKFHIRITQDVFPQVMVDCVMSDEQGYRLFSIPMSLLWRYGHGLVA